MNKWQCGDCGHIADDKDFLQGPSPFRPGDIIVACPNCGIEFGASLRMICDVPECTQLADCGTPTPKGYRNTCSAHKPIVEPQ